MFKELSMPELPPPPVNVEVVVVYPPRLAPLGGEAAFSAVQVGPEIFKTQPRLDEALKTVPGVSLFRRTGIGGGQSDDPGAVAALNRAVRRGPGAGDPGRRAGERPVRRLGDLDRLAERGAGGCNGRPGRGRGSPMARAP
jgi:hypothetical protein